jgi:hypothetical protein
MRIIDHCAVEPFGVVGDSRLACIRASDGLDNPGPAYIAVLLPWSGLSNLFDVPALGTP